MSWSFSAEGGNVTDLNEYAVEALTKLVEDQTDEARKDEIATQGQVAIDAVQVLAEGLEPLGDGEEFRAMLSGHLDISGTPGAARSVSASVTAYRP